MYEILASNKTFSSLEPACLMDMAQRLQTLRFQAGDYLMLAGVRTGSGLYILVSGRVQALLHPFGGEQVVGELQAGAIFGEMELITGQTRQASIRAVSEGEVVFLPKKDFDEFVGIYPDILNHLGEVVRQRLRRNQLARLLPSFFGPISLEEIDDIEQHAVWVHLNRGDILMRMGEVDGYFYIVVNGRLEAKIPDANGIEQVVTVLQMGNSIGEMQVYTNEPRSANVYAVRNAELVRFSRDDIFALQVRYPKLNVHVMRQIMDRLRRITAKQVTFNISWNFAFVPLGPEVPMREFVHDLKTALASRTSYAHYSSPMVDDILDSDGAAQLPPEDINEIRLLTWLDEQENTYKYLFYEADAQLTPWTARHILRADKIIFVGNAASTPDMRYIEQLRAFLNTHQVETCRELVLYYPENTSRKAPVSAWLQPFEPVSRHYHVHAQRDFARFARLQTGGATGLVLGGGGARGFAHIGVLKAIQELGLEIDLVGGTSMGSIVGGAYALGLDLETIYQTAKSLSAQKRMIDYTFPITSFAAGRPFTQALINLFGDCKIEDTWREFFCVSTNLTQAQEMVHRRGLLWRYTRASSALPPVFVPVLDGDDLLVDGVVVNNLPVDVMQTFCEGGKVIGVDVSSEEHLAGEYDFEPVMSGWQVLLRRLNPLAQNVRVPKLFNIALRVAELNSVRLKRRQYDRADLMIRPDVEGFDIFQIKAIDKLIARGYEAGISALTGWDPST